MNEAQSILSMAEFYAAVLMILSVIIRFASNPKDSDSVYVYKSALIIGEGISVFLFANVGLYFLMFAMCYYLLMDLWEFKKIIFKNKTSMPKTDFDIRSWFEKMFWELAYILTLLFIAASLGKWMAAATATGWPAHLVIDKLPYTDALAALLLTYPHAQSVNGRPGKLFYVFLGYIVAFIACFEIKLYLFSILLATLSTFTIKAWFIYHLDFGGAYYDNRY